MGSTMTGVYMERITVPLDVEGDPSEVLAAFTRHRRRLHALLKDFDEPDWRGPTRCAKWSVLDVVNHLTWVSQAWTWMHHSSQQGRPSALFTSYDPNTTPDLAISDLRDLQPSDALQRLVDADNSLLSVLETYSPAEWEQLSETPAGWVPARVAPMHALFDGWIHERDILLPAGEMPAAEPDEVEFTLTYLAGLASYVGSLVTGIQPGSMTVAVDGALTTTVIIDCSEGVTVTTGHAPEAALHATGDAIAIAESICRRVPPTEALSGHEKVELLFGSLTPFFL